MTELGCSKRLISEQDLVENEAIFEQHYQYCYSLQTLLLRHES